VEAGVSEVVGAAGGDFDSSEADASPAAASAAAKSTVPQTAANLAPTAAGRPQPSLRSVVSGAM